ncbi:MAG: GTPase domain-containing protein [uncultured Thiotrichaceae bacterium]|uniref:GTPase domain-containing protein n=1 Tax=uncultured Thiotrichaceae bacterium TaxID=298394 RepID=A0A6S6UDC0_9GAMM|nr:MAG: GTPase domain-containing protein [uncultured Thiotrichaceae bacterium]
MTYESVDQQPEKPSNNTAQESQTECETSVNISPDEMEAVINETVEIAANNIVKNHIIASITLGLVPIPLFDLAALTTTQMNMLRSLSELYDVPFEDSNSKSLVTSLVGGSLPVLGVLGLSSFAKLIPGIGSLVGSASLSITAGAVTYAVGQVFIMHFSEGGTLDDFNPKQAQVYFKREFEAGKTFVQDIKDEVKAMKAAKEPESGDS